MNHVSMPKRALALDLAEALVRSAAGQRHAGRVLHDDVGPLLSAAGLRLQLLRMDFPDAAERARQVMETLEDAMDRVRTLSQRLNPSAVDRVGFQKALEAMVETHRPQFAGRLQLRCAATARLPLEAAVPMYEAADAAVGDAVHHSGASQIVISVAGSGKGGSTKIALSPSGKVSVRVEDNGRRRSHRGLAMAAQIARGAGLEFDVLAGKGTIVCIQYAFRRSSGG
jgi:signal transduction histidine kinase